MRSRMVAALQAGAWGVLIAVLSVTAYLALFILGVLSIGFVALGVGVFLAPFVVLGIRGLANEQRRLALRLSGVEIEVPYRAAPANLAPFGVIGCWQRCRWLLTDQATYRDLLWMLVGVPVGLVLGLLPGCLVVYGVEGIVVAPILGMTVHGYGYGPIWPVDSPVKALMTIPIGVVLLVLAGWVGPSILKVHAQVSAYFLRPTRNAVLAQRVTRLAETRADAVDAQAAELRRIERDLHDGAQARLVALSMNIGLAEELLRSDPESALELLAEARQASGHALTELRGLVRGIHPPVLAERGLEGAVQALALTLPMRVEVDIDVPGRAEAPVESAAYFAVAEILANVVKHSGAEQATVRLRHDGVRLHAEIRDDGVGGADPARGSGLQGVARRLSAFDGTMGVTSPPGGPTVVTLELPCALSSPKISPSSETG